MTRAVESADDGTPSELSRLGPAQAGVGDQERQPDVHSAPSIGTVGAIMTLQTGGEIRLKSRMIEGAEENSQNTPDAFLLDGQQ